MRYGILEAPPKVAFDRITALAANLLQMTVAMIAFTDANRIWIKSSHGTDMVEMHFDEDTVAMALGHKRCEELALLALNDCPKFILRLTDLLPHIVVEELSADSPVPAPDVVTEAQTLIRRSSDKAEN